MTLICQSCSWVLLHSTIHMNVWDGCNRQWMTLICQSCRWLLLHSTTHMNVWDCCNRQLVSDTSCMLLWCVDNSATLLVCPGIANSSESVYIRTFVYHAQQNGFRVAVLNHLGALADVPLTSPRIYTYGLITFSISNNLSQQVLILKYTVQAWSM